MGIGRRTHHMVAPTFPGAIEETSGVGVVRPLLNQGVQGGDGILPASGVEGALGAGERLDELVFVAGAVLEFPGFGVVGVEGEDGTGMGQAFGPEVGGGGLTGLGQEVVDTGLFRRGIRRGWGDVEDAAVGGAEVEDRGAPFDGVTGAVEAFAGFTEGGVHGPTVGESAIEFGGEPDRGGIADFELHGDDRGDAAADQGLGDAGEEVGGGGAGAFAAIKDHQAEGVFVAEIDGQVAPGDFTTALVVVFEEEHAFGSGSLGVEAAVADEVKDVVLALAELGLEGGQGGGGEAVDAQESALGEGGEGGVESLPLLFDVEGIMVGGAGDHDQDAEGWLDLEGLDAFGEFEVMNERGAGGEEKELAVAGFVEEFPRKIGEVGGVVEAEPQSEAAVLSAGFGEAAGPDFTDVTGEDGFEELGAELAGGEGGGGFEASNAAGALADLEEVQLQAILGERQGERARGMAGGRLDHDGAMGAIGAAFETEIEVEEILGGHGRTVQPGGRWAGVAGIPLVLATGQGDAPEQKGQS